MTHGNKKFWFSQEQVQEMYRVKLDLEFAQEDNLLLNKFIMYQDSIIQRHEYANLLLNNKVDETVIMYENQLDITKQWEQKYRISQNTINSLQNVKKALIITSGVVVLATIIAIIK